MGKENSMHLNQINENDDMDFDDDDSCDYPTRKNGGPKTDESCDFDTGLSAGDASEQQEVIANQETKDVFRLKLVVVLVLVTSAAIVAASFFFYLSNNEKEQFHTQFNENANKVLDAIGMSVDKTLSLFDSVAVSLVSNARVTNQTWPFVTIPNFALRMSKLLPLTNAVNINVLPLVTPHTRREWEVYTLRHHDWVNEGMKFQSTWNGYYGPIVYDGIPQGVIHGDFGDLDYNITRNFLPTWQSFPVIANVSWTFNYDWLSVSFPESYTKTLEKHTAAFSKPYMIPTPGDAVAEAETEIWADVFRDYISPTQETKEPVSDLSFPIIDEVVSLNMSSADYNPANHKIVGILGASMYWRAMITSILPEGSNGIYVVFDNPCTQSFTYQIDGPNVTYLGVGDEHSTDYESLGKHRTLRELFEHHESTYAGARLDGDFCPMTIHVYPSHVMKDAYMTHNPVLFTVAAIFIFLFTSLVFYLYDAKVERRQETVMKSAVRSGMIVSSLFPSAVRDRLYPETEKAPVKKTFDLGMLSSGHNQNNFRTGSTPPPPLSSTAAGDVGIKGSPIAELYPETTVLFADIAGFTAWSSTRQPTQVFHLLETLYAGFDKIAKQRGVFKVETIGDCYVAVVGLPTPRIHHAVVMARFASDCCNIMRELTAELDKTLGPGTADLALRVGLNSGPTTAGVLRGEKSRFQLFGDTVNTAARMESNGERYRIHVSQKTAELISEAGKGHWLTPRDEQVHCKGKGLMTTFWCEPKVGSAVGSGSDVRTSDASHPDLCIDKVELFVGADQRLIEWNVDMFTDLLKKVIAHRQLVFGNKQPIDTAKVTKIGKGAPVDEVTEVLHLPKASSNFDLMTDNVQISPVVAAQLREFITCIAEMYQKNPFHNFEHCSHVAMSTTKLLDRITKGGSLKEVSSSNGTLQLRETMSDPLTRFAIVFAAIIHDIDHPGVSNAQLVQEHNEMAITYNNKSVAEQNSIDQGWNLLMKPQFADLRACIVASDSELKRFRQVVVNVVMATDLFDQNLKSMRESRWTKSFQASTEEAALEGDHADRRATIILDLIIQVSDVCHTMQHFTIYKKWNMCLLDEMYLAFQLGRTEKDPTKGWYEGELWFFDNYIIPLASKLRECGVFGVSCDEFLDYAKDNRLEWELKGRDIVKEAKRELIKRHADLIGNQRLDC